MWNAHNTVFGSKHSAICVLAVYFVHLTRPKIQCLVSHDSTVDRQFIIAWVRFMCHTVPSTVITENLGGGEFLVWGVQATGMTLN